ncbi:serine/threonine-protein kinase [[Mycobacterium] kokjensenii]|uniref:non-specific serine/threonine protein kinase n=1 Tax=[Mycobacterium] kokjensenii TaxID=3064287 RepID=A0ABN9MUU3_9MYCO|nr:serine/threonine-protein kinase [Mycolicibacter sp. MU0083]CAJ1493826.1 serine/threonine-protein kinase [Mycolicibacter sp. MU0083]
MLTAGSTFADYRIIRLLGSGGMGEVYLAEHPRLPRRDALKVLPANLSADPEFRERFNREADLAASLWHPQIVGVHDRGEFNGQLWIAMDYVEGSGAAEWLKCCPGGLPRAQVAEIVLAVAQALDYAHERGLLHRDVKPANILLSEPGESGGRILLADFGIGLRVDEVSGLTATNMAIGTLRYAAPEQLRGEAIDGRADQYALAATAYHLLTGTPPVHLDPAGLDAVLARALAADPAARYRSCTEFAVALHQGEPVPLRELAPPAIVSPAKRRHGKGLALAAAGFAALYFLGTSPNFAPPKPVPPVAAPTTSTTTVTRSVVTTVPAPVTTTTSPSPAPATTSAPVTTSAPATTTGAVAPLLGVGQSAGGPSVPEGLYAIPSAMPFGTYAADIGPTGSCTFAVINANGRVVTSGTRLISLNKVTVEIDPRAEDGTFASYGCTPWTRIRALPGDW